MNKSLQTNNVSVCYKNSCIHAKGRNAKRIAVATSIMLLLVGIAALAKASN